MGGLLICARSMGVPGFYRWAVRNVKGLRHRGSKAPYEFDNVYLDFNGVVHSCIDQWAGQENEEVLFALIEAELALLLAIAVPRVLLFIAIDGVAPRAKMNQQRSRRFRAAQEAALAADTVEGVCKSFDRNSVTPGTDFMDRLSRRLQDWAEAQASTPQLQGVTVVISDDRDPGEGEHKIMEVVRCQPNYTHCLVSADADLVFLGLVSPADQVYLLRAKQSHRESGPPDPVTTDQPADVVAAAVAAGADEYELLSVVAIRHFLQQQFPGCDAKRVAIDFVAMCCLAGNDFLPHIPAVDIYMGGIDRVLNSYKNMSPATNGYLVSEDGRLRLPHWRGLLEQLAPAEAEATLDDLGLGLGPRQQPYKGPGPPTADWDGLSVLVSYAPAAATAEGVLNVMSKQGCQAVQALQTRGRGSGQRPPTFWLVRFADASSALQTLTATRRMGGMKMKLDWVIPSKCDLLEAPGEPFVPVSWQAELDAAIREQFEFYFCKDNLAGDAYLRRHVRSRADRFVPISVIMQFNRMQALSQDIATVVRALSTSSRLEVQGDGEGALVRAAEDFSARPGETPEVIAQHNEALRCIAARECSRACNALGPQFYAKHSGLVAAGAPPEGDIEGMAQHRSTAFFVGIEWVVQYYTRGCSSWSWFYPAHYPPLCASLAAQVDRPLEPPPLNAPYPPELQLLSVLPPKSAGLLPQPLRKLVLDPSSPVAEFYPDSFEVDKKEGDRDWQAIILLPFVDEARLRAALTDVQGAGARNRASAAADPAHAFRAALSTEDAIAESSRSPFMKIFGCCSGDADSRGASASVLNSPGSKGFVNSWDFQALAHLFPAWPLEARRFPAASRPEEAPAQEESASGGRGKGGGGRGRGGRGKGKGRRGRG